VTCVERAAAIYAKEPCSGTFRSDLEAHLLYGFVFSRPDFFVMGRPVIKAAPYAEIVDPWQVFPSSQCDCWHVFLMAGNVARALAMIPWELPWLSFERRNVLRFARLDRIRGLSGPQHQGNP
jgi:hypothetical protein